MSIIALTGGGTAGHITPNLALIPELEKRGHKIIYIGSKDGMEKDIIERHHITFFGISCDKLRRYFDFKNFFIPLNVIKGINEARKILKENKAEILFSKGGYVAVPVVIAAKQLKIPVISHEADFTPGLANKIATPFSKVVCCNFSETAKMIKNNKGAHTGCPVRPMILSGNRENGKKLLNFKEKKPILLIMGGSLGSVYINNLIRSNLLELLKHFNIVHSCGKGKIDKKLINKYDGYRQYEIILDELPDIFAASDIIVSRAGANFIFEVMALKKLSLLIPLSLKASRGDQILNAKNFQEKHYAEMLLEEEQDKNKNLFLEKLLKLYNNRKEYFKSIDASNLKDGTIKICDIICENIP